MFQAPPIDTLEHFTEQARLPGWVCCRFDARHVLTETRGFRDPSLGLAMEPDCRFPIASVTKTFTAHLVQAAAARGLFRLDDPLSRVWPGFRPADPAAAAEMTLREALGHLSGLPPHTWAWVFGDLSRADFFQRRFPHLEPAGPFREKHRYSNLLYAALGSLLEHVTGEDWETCLQKTLLKPLGLRHTQPLTESWAETTPLLARPHADGAPPQSIEPFVAKTRHLIAPASELLSTAPDLARWGQFLLQLPPGDARWQAVSEVAPGLAYGLGWRMDRIHGVRRVWHSGQCSGYTALLSLFPERGEGLALLTNRSAAVEALEHLSSLLLFPGASPPPLLPPPPPRAVKAPAPFHGRIPEGDFIHPGYGNLTVFGRDGRVWCRFQDADAVELQADDPGNPLLVLPVYGARFPLRTGPGGTLLVPFEPQLPPIVFSRI